MVSSVDLALTAADILDRDICAEVELLIQQMAKAQQIINVVVKTTSLWNIELAIVEFS